MTQDNFDTGIARPFFSGLSQNEVSQAQYHLPKTSKKSHTKSTTRIAAENSLTVFNLINVAVIVGLYALYRHNSDIRLLLDSLGIILVVIANTSLAIIQEWRTRSILEAARLLKETAVTVIRDGTPRALSPSELVAGDLVELTQGDAVIGDGVILWAQGIELDESHLTGESHSIEKRQGDEIFSGSVVVAGTGVMRIDILGNDSRAGRLTREAQYYKFSPTPIQKKVDLLFVASFLFALLFLGAEVLLSPSIDILSDVETLRRMATVVITLLPEGLVFFATVILAAGVYRLMKDGIYIQKLNAVASFSEIGAVCLDKTGTLTTGKLTLSAMIPLDSSLSDQELRRVLGSYARFEPTGNATTKALRELDFGEATLHHAIGFSSERKYSAIEMAMGHDKGVWVLGAAERLLPWCEMKGDIENDVRLSERMDSSTVHYGRRLLFCRLKKGDAHHLALLHKPKTIPEKAITLHPLAWLMFEDEVRPDAQSGLSLFKKEGIEMKILSGDAAPTVLKTLHTLGLSVEEPSVLNRSITSSPQVPWTKEEIRSATVFARLTPEDKADIIRYINTYTRTAMIGDGVNDIPAMKEASLSVAMDSGSKVTKEISDIILKGDRFSSLAAIIDEGRRAQQAILAVAKLYMTKNLLVLLLEALSLFFGTLFPLTPRRSGLLGVLGVAFPVFFILRYNENHQKTQHFFSEFFCFIAVSLAIIPSTSFFSLLLGDTFYSLSLDERKMMMTTVLLLMCCLNFIILMHRLNPHKTPLALAAVMGIVICYGGLVHGLGSFWPLQGIILFYEIEPFAPSLWVIMAPCVLLGGMLLWGGHCAAEWGVKRFTKSHNPIPDAT